MPYRNEFPKLARVTNNMDAKLLYEMGQNLTAHDVDTRIEYEQWMEFEKEYGHWSDGQSQYASRNDWYENQAIATNWRS